MLLILAAIVGAFLSLIGVALIWAPFNAVQAFGIDPSHLADIGLAPALGTRELAIGLAVMALAGMRASRPLGVLLLAASIVPLADFAIAAKAFGQAAAIRHLITLPFTFLPGLILLWRAS